MVPEGLPLDKKQKFDKKQQTKALENARNFSKNCTTQKNIRISRLEEDCKTYTKKKTSNKKLNQRIEKLQNELYQLENELYQQAKDD